MKILVVGSGGREHAIIRKLKQSPKAETIYCCPGNGGISMDAQCVDIKAMDIDGVVRFSKENSIDLVVVAPDDPLAAGMVDALNQEGIMTFGPTKDAAQIEASKVFSKNLMKEFHIPTAAYEVFDDPAKALCYIEEKNEYPVVIKADGLALGKGVIIAASHEEAKEGLHEIMEEKVFGTSGNHVVVEEFLTGPEVSVLAFVDGKTVVPMVSSMDHKRALDGDKGLNTGGMGTIAPNPFYTPEVAQECMEKIFKPTVAAMASLGRPFKGCLYFGLMLTPKGPYVIEYNSRFGDPETQVVLELLDSDLVETTAHSGARPSHARWQGQVFSRSGKSKKYPDFRRATGYGTGPGLGGWNCRHSFHPYFDGMARTYGAKELKKLEAKSITYNGEKLTEYEASQRQRYIERQIRRWKREQQAMKSAGQPQEEAKAKLKEWRARQTDLVEQTGLKRQYDRERAGG